MWCISLVLIIFIYILKKNENIVKIDTIIRVLKRFYLYKIFSRVCSLSRLQSSNKMETKCIL